MLRPVFAARHSGRRDRGLSVPQRGQRSRENRRAEVASSDWFQRTDVLLGLAMW